MPPPADRSHRQALPDRREQRETSIEDHLRGGEVSTIVFAGCNFPNCPRTSIYEASERDFRLLLAEDAISGLYDRGREELTGIGITLMPAADIIRALEQAVSVRAS